jgi:DNA mismatch repair protein MutS
MQIINNALSQLNLISTTQTQQSVKDLFCKPQTAMGRRELETRLCMPMTIPSHIRKRHDEIEWILQNKEAQEQLDTCLILIYDLARLHRKIVRGTIQGDDILQLYQSYTSSQTIWTICFDSKSPFQEPKEIPSFLQASLEVFQSLFDIEKAKKAKKEEKEDEISFLKDSPSVKNIQNVEDEIKRIYEDAAKWLTTFTKEYSLDSTSIYYKPTEKNMFSLTCTKATVKLIEKQKDKPYKGLVVKALTSSARVEHPEIDAFQVRLDISKAKLQRLLYSEIPRVCIEYQNATQNYWFPIETWILNIDLAICMAKTASLYGFCRPVIEDTTTQSGVWIEHMRHPLIEIQKTKSRYVTHTIDLGYSSVQESSWLLYGMNASGKSSMMKAIGLSVLLAQVGSYVPATKMRLRPFKKLATRILNQDNLWAGLSSFAVEMSELRHIFEVADHETLVLGDELCSGTESVSATAIVAAGISWLHKCGTRFVLATHLHDLMKLPEIQNSPSLKVWHLHVEYDRIRECLIYHRELRPGSGSTLYGLEVAKALQLPSEMLLLAHEYRKRLLDETSLEKLKKSSWNKDVVRQACEVCFKKIESDLEVHHVQPREKSEDGQRNQDGTALHSVKNLAVLCTECHDKHHNGTIDIGPVQDTSDGPKRIISLENYRFKEREKAEKKEKTEKTEAVKIKGFTNEEIEAIKKTIDENKHLHKKLIMFQIQKHHGIQITDVQLKKFLD